MSNLSAWDRHFHEAQPLPPMDAGPEPLPWSDPASHPDYPASQIDDYIKAGDEIKEWTTRQFSPGTGPWDIPFGQGYGDALPGFDPDSNEFSQDPFWYRNVVKQLPGGVVEGEPSLEPFDYNASGGNYEFSGMGQTFSGYHPDDPNKKFIGVYQSFTGDDHPEAFEWQGTWFRPMYTDQEYVDDWAAFQGATRRQPGDRSPFSLNNLLENKDPYGDGTTPLHELPPDTDLSYLPDHDLIAQMAEEGSFDRGEESQGPEASSFNLGGGLGVKMVDGERVHTFSILDGGRPRNHESHKVGHYYYDGYGNLRHSLDEGDHGLRTPWHSGLQPGTGAKTYGWTPSYYAQDYITRPLFSFAPTHYGHGWDDWTRGHDGDNAYEYTGPVSTH